MPSVHRLQQLSVAVALVAIAGLVRLHAQVDTGQSRLFRFLMGTSVRVELSGGDSQRRAEAADEAFAAIAEVERIMSRYRQDSELTHLNASGAMQPVVVSGPLFAVVAVADRIDGASRGAFSAVVAGRGTPRPVVLNAADHSIRFARADVRLDLDGLAKGFAAELAAGSLRRRGLSGTVDIGGVQYMTGLPPGKRVWSVGLADPARRGVLLGALDVTAGAVATVTRASVQPRAAAMPEGALPVSATVVSSDGTLADALSRAAVLLPPADALALLSRFPDTWGLLAVRRAEGTLGTLISQGHTADFHPAASH